MEVYSSHRSQPHFWPVKQLYTNKSLKIPAPNNEATHELKPHFHQMDGEQETSNKSANSSETFSYLPWHISYPGQKDSTSPLRWSSQLQAPEETWGDIWKRLWHVSKQRALLYLALSYATSWKAQHYRCFLHPRWRTRWKSETLDWTLWHRLSKSKNLF